MQISVGLTMVLSFVTTNIVSMRAGPVIREMTVGTSAMRKTVQVKLLDQLNINPFHSDGLIHTY